MDRLYVNVYTFIMFLLFFVCLLLPSFKDEYNFEENAHCLQIRETIFPVKVLQRCTNFGCGTATRQLQNKYCFKLCPSVAPLY